MNANYDIADTFNVFFEGKYVEATSTTFSEGDGFYDTLFIQAIIRISLHNYSLLSLRLVACC